MLRASGGRVVVVRWPGWQVILLVSSLAMAAGGGALLFAPATGAAEVVITVTRSADGTGSCTGSGTSRTCPTLRAAVIEANGLTDPVTIRLGADTYELFIPPATDDTTASGDLDVTKRGGVLRVRGEGSNRTVIAGAWPAGESDRLIDVGSGATVVLEGLTLTGGAASHEDPRDFDGGAVWVGGVLQLSDVQFVSNSAQKHGGAVFVAPSGTIVLAPDAGTIVFEGNQAGASAEEPGNGGALAVEGTVILDGTVRLTGNQASGVGGAIWVKDGRLVLGSRVSIGGAGASDPNQAGVDGGGVAVEGGQVELQGTLVRGNVIEEREGRGGGLWVAKGQVTLRGATVVGNRAGLGGGIATDEGILTLLDSEVRENQAMQDGGGLAILGRGSGQIIGGTIAGNTAVEGDGGGLFNAGTLALSRTVIEGNTAEAGSGGGILNSGTLDLSSPETVIVRGNRARLGGGVASIGSARLRSLIVQNNEAAQDGGGIWNSGEMLLDGASIEGNRTDGTGGGIHHTGSKTLTVQGNSVVRSNQATLDGGGIAAYGKVVFSGATIEGNRTGGSGGGVLAANQAEFRSVQLIDNQAANDGGGVLVGEAGKVTLSDTAIRRSTAGQLGGGIAVRSGGQLVAQASSVTENQALSYGGGIATLGSVGLTNVTVSTNVSQQRGGGLWVGPQGSATLQFVTMASNAAAAGGALYNDGGTVTLRGALIAASPGGGNCGGIAPSSQGGNLEDRDSCVLRGSGDQANAAPNLQPLQVDSTYGTLFHALGLGSPAIDAAGTQSCPADDQLHTKRPQGSACDIGAYEYPVPEVTPMPSAVPTGTPGATPVATPRTTPTVGGSLTGPATPVVGRGPTPTPTIGLPNTGTADSGRGVRLLGLGLIMLGLTGTLAGGVGLVRAERRERRGAAE
ncbi:putative outer membrane protein pmp20 [bacterium HR28]|nr:putative outer membrane protein pmp20 [bacterium HR28]